MNLQQWSQPTSAQLTLRGWHSVPSGKPVLHFLHGNGFCGRVYTPLLELLSADYDLWLCDIQGHGDSDLGERFLGWNRNAALAVEVFNAQRAIFADAPVYAAGHSFGGVLTSLIMAQHPHLFRAAVLLDPVIYTPRLQLLMRTADRLGVTINQVAKKTLKRRRHWPDRAAAYAAYAALTGRGAFQGWAPEALASFVDYALRPAAEGGVELKCPPELEARIFASAPSRLWSSLRRVQTPALFMYGAHSFPFVPKSAQLWAQKNEQVQLEQVPGGHCFMQQDPALAAQHTLAFLSRY